jgi:hypothetical protein
MRIGREILKAAIFLMVSTTSQGMAITKTDADTLRTKFLEMYWTKERFVPKIGASVQERALLELGVQWHNIYKHPLSLASKGPYASVDLLIDKKNFLIGPKLGYEFTAGVFGAAFDVTYYYDKDYDAEGNNRRAFVGTPKGGLTLLGFMNVFYGYQIPLSEQRITTLSRHRFSITLNLNKDYFNLKNAPRKP